MKGANTAILVPREGFSDRVARELLRLEPTRFTALLNELAWGEEWVLRKHRLYVLLPGMAKLGVLAGSELRFEPGVGFGQVATVEARNWLEEWEAKREEAGEFLTTEYTEGTEK